MRNTMAGPTREFWQQRFVANETPWDRGAASPQLAAWLASGALTPCRALVPGCGGGYEVVALAQAGFNVTALDYAPAAIALTRERLAQANAQATLVQADALEWPPPPYTRVPHPRGWQELAVVLAHRSPTVAST